MSGHSIDPAMIASLLAKPERSSTARKKKDPTDTRDHLTWFKLDHIIDSECAYDKHDEVLATVATDKKGRNRIVVEVKGVHICRLCYLSGALLTLDKPPDEV